MTDQELYKPPALRKPTGMAKDRRSRRQDVDKWHKEYCRVNMIPWGKVLETKKLMNLFPEVEHWNDVAAKNAFDDAKKRYFSMIHGRGWRNPELPDPNMFIDVVVDKVGGTAVDQALYDELEKITPYGDLEEEYYDHKPPVVAPEPAAYFTTKLEDIVPTGWDVDFDDGEPSIPQVITTD